MVRRVNRAWFCAAKRVGRGLAQITLTPKIVLLLDIALLNRVLSAGPGVNFENAKSIPMLAAKARAGRGYCALWNQSASRVLIYRTVANFGAAKNEEVERRRSAAQSFRRYIVVGCSFNAFAPLMDYICLTGRYMKWQTFYKGFEVCSPPFPSFPDYFVRFSLRKL